MTAHVIDRPHAPRRTAVVLVAVLATAYATSQLLRNSVGVIGPDLMRELGIEARTLGLMSSTLFATFAAAQIPVGIAIDRWGPRATMLPSLALAAIACVLFATAQTATGLIAARAVLGFGVGCLLMAPLAIFSRWFAAERFSTMTGLIFALGNIGTLSAAAPLGFAAATLGWRGAFLGIAAFTVIVLLCVALIVRDTPPGTPARAGGRESLGAALRGVARAVRTPHVWRLFFMQFTSYSTFASLFGLWAVPWLETVHGMDGPQRGLVLTGFGVAQMVGLAMWGPTDRLFGSYRVPVTLASCLSLCFLAVGIAWPLMPAAMVAAWFVALGLTLSCTSVLTAQGRTLFPPELVGRGMTVLNLGNMLGVFVQQTVTGLIIGHFPRSPAGAYPPEAYQWAFAYLAVCLALALAYYQGVRARR